MGVVGRPSSALFFSECCSQQIFCLVLKQVFLKVSVWSRAIPEYLGVAQCSRPVPPHHTCSILDVSHFFKMENTELCFQLAWLQLVIPVAHSHQVQTLGQFFLGRLESYAPHYCQIIGISKTPSSVWHGWSLVYMLNSIGASTLSCRSFFGLSILCCS